jgi:hypothetical protein
MIAHSQLALWSKERMHRKYGTKLTLYCRCLNLSSKTQTNSLMTSQHTDTSSMQLHFRQRAAAPDRILAAPLCDNCQRGQRRARQAEAQQVQRPVVVAGALLPPQQHLAAQLRHHRAAVVAHKAWAVTTLRASPTALCCRVPCHGLGTPSAAIWCRWFGDRFLPCVEESGKKGLWVSGGQWPVTGSYQSWQYRATLHRGQQISSLLLQAIRAATASVSNRGPSPIRPASEAFMTAMSAKPQMSGTCCTAPLCGNCGRADRDASGCSCCPLSTS